MDIQIKDENNKIKKYSEIAIGNILHIIMAQTGLLAKNYWDYWSLEIRSPQFDINVVNNLDNIIRICKEIKAKCFLIKEICKFCKYGKYEKNEDDEMYHCDRLSIDVPIDFFCKYFMENKNI